MTKRFVISVLLSVLLTAVCVAQGAPGYPYAPAPTSSGYNPYADPLASGYVPYASAPALGYNPYAVAPPAPVYNPYAMVPAGPNPAAYGPGAYAGAPPTLTSEIMPITPPWETGALPWPLSWPTQAAREWLPELADPWIPGTGKPRQQVPAPVAAPVYFIVTGPLTAKREPSANSAKVIPRMPPQDTTQYWVQVGAYKTRVNAQEAFNRAAIAGFSPTFAISEGWVRVLIPGVRGSDMREAAARLYNAGFKEILLRNKP
ncbi:hypothetical protein AGMMS49942_03250 [Spirochaetia bacterium]|nr:hypothetical protein AGMMS49942_03250 [Spirochaetia bacterium]